VTSVLGEEKETRIQPPFLCFSHLQKSCKEIKNSGKWTWTHVDSHPKDKASEVASMMRRNSKKQRKGEGELVWFWWWLGWCEKMYGWVRRVEIRVKSLGEKRGSRRWKDVNGVVVEKDVVRRRILLRDKERYCSEDEDYYSLLIFLFYLVSCISFYF